MANGNGWIVKTAIGLGASAIIGVQTFTGNVVFENRETNIKEHNAIMKEVISSDNILRDKIDSVKDIALDIKAEQKALKMFLEKKL